MSDEVPASEGERTVAFLLSLRARGVRDLALLRAMERVPRDRFAPARFADLARQDVSVPLPCGQTMTAPYTVASLLVALDMQPGARVLEVGTGSGYVSTLLAAMGGEVVSLERYRSLALAAHERVSGSGFGQAVLAQRDRADLAGETDFAEHHRVCVERATTRGGGDGARDTEIDRGFGDTLVAGRGYGDSAVRHQAARSGLGAVRPGIGAQPGRMARHPD